MISRAVATRPLAVVVDVKEREVARAQRLHDGQAHDRGVAGDARPAHETRAGCQLVDDGAAPDERACANAEVVEFARVARCEPGGGAVRFGIGISDCRDCGKWHPALVEEPEGAAVRIGGVQCGSCFGINTRYMRINIIEGEDEAKATLIEWLQDNGATWKGQPEAEVFLWPTAPR